MSGNNQDKSEIRDLREKSKFIVDDKFLNGYAKFLGIYCVGVYNSLCRHANKEQKCWPKEETICFELSIGKNSVVNSIQRLEFWKIIRKKRIGKTCSNRYFLLDKKCWKPINEDTLKEYSEVCEIKFNDLRDKLQRFVTQHSKERKHNRKETKEKGDPSYEKLANAYREKTSNYKRPFFLKDEMRWSENKWWVIPKDKGRWLEFAGKKSAIEWR